MNVNGCEWRWKSFWPKFFSAIHQLTILLHAPVSDNFSTQKRTIFSKRGGPNFFHAPLSSQHFIWYHTIKERQTTTFSLPNPRQHQKPPRMTVKDKVSKHVTHDKPSRFPLFNFRRDSMASSDGSHKDEESTKSKCISKCTKGRKKLYQQHSIGNGSFRYFRWARISIGWLVNRWVFSFPVAVFQWPIFHYLQ